MKEIKYTSEKGFENKNTFTQFDQFEQIALKGAKNRYIYDFSHSSRNLNPDAIDFNGKTYGQYYYGVAGGKTEFVTENGFGRIYDYDNNKNTEYFENYGVPTVNGVDDFGNPIVGTVPYFNENTIGFIDQQYNIWEMGAGGNPANFVDSFRAGYFEITFKTSKQNCVIATGASRLSPPKHILPVGWVVNDDFLDGINVQEETVNMPNSLHEGKYFKQDKNAAFNKTQITLKNGIVTLTHKDDYGDDAVVFEVSGLTNVADGEWHHIVVNFGRPGLLKDASSKFNEKFIEFWVDGKLDKRIYEEINSQKLFYSTMNFILSDPEDILELVTNKKVEIDDWDYVYPDANMRTDEENKIGGPENTIGTQERRPYLSQMGLSKMNKPTSKNFKGAVHTIAIGINIPLTYDEIATRYNYWKSIKVINVEPIKATAYIINPTITTNKKKALKLYWNNLDFNKNGLELDNNFSVDSYCVTHKTKNSVSEIYNVDVANKKTLNLLSNVKVAFKDNLMIWGPGLISIGNTYEAVYKGVSGGIESTNQLNPADLVMYDNVTNVNLYKQTAGKTFIGPLADLSISGLNLNAGERILLTGQIKPSQNGIWIYNGLDKQLTRPDDFNSPEKINNAIVYVEDGYLKNTYWHITNTILTIDDPEIWTVTDSYNENLINIEPQYISRWVDYKGNERFINLEEDINISKYDIICFINYPETTEEVARHFTNKNSFEVDNLYKNFISSIRNVTANGASLYVSSPKLAVDLGIVKKFTEVNQFLESSDLQSALISPFEASEPAERYFDTHRINKYHVATTINGLTNKQTYLLTDFINYTPENINENEQYHAKYIYRQFGLIAGDEFIIPSLALTNKQNSDNLPGYANNQRNIKPMMAVDPSDINVGTIITKLSNNYYVGSTPTTNPYDDFATTIIVHNGQVLKGQPITGRIFINCVEDAYTLSRNDYNSAQIQIIPNNDPYETTSTRAWQYSTTRLNREPRKINIRSMTQYGQTTPTVGGGGAIIQAPTNSSNGIIRSSTDSGNINYQSDLYTSESEEVYGIQKIPVLSMTYLGLQWLAE
jgi:hypothetical protein